MTHYHVNARTRLRRANYQKRIFSTHLKLLIVTLEQNRVVFYPGHHFQTQTTTTTTQFSKRIPHKPQSN